MTIPMRQSARIAGYLLKQKIKRTEKFPLLVELEPLYQCNLACSFCGKIQHPDHILRKRKPVDLLCTTGILMKNKMDNFEPSPYFAWVVNLDGMRERHDQFVEREGVFDKCVDAIKEAQRRGFR